MRTAAAAGRQRAGRLYSVPSWTVVRCLARAIVAPCYMRDGAVVAHCCVALVDDILKRGACWAPPRGRQYTHHLTHTCALKPLAMGDFGARPTI